VKKKSLWIIVILLYSILIAGVFFFFGYQTAENRMENAGSALNTQTFYATISEVDDYSLIVKGLEVNDINFRGDFVLSLSEETVLLWRGTDISVNELNTGDRIAVTFSGEVLESYPAQIKNTDRIQLLDDKI
jgi:hypothetical protein